LVAEMKQDTNLTGPLNRVMTRSGMKNSAKPTVAGNNAQSRSPI
jgi:hypothetical protein